MDEPKTYQIAGCEVTCTHCEQQRFYKRRSAPNGRDVALFDLAWQNGGADNYICAHCGHLMWFFGLPPQADIGESASRLENLFSLEDTGEEEEVIAPVPEEEVPESEGVPEPTECLSCGEMIPSYQTRCRACGWSYRSEPEG